MLTLFLFECRWQIYSRLPFIYDLALNFVTSPKEMGKNQQITMVKIHIAQRENFLILNVQHICNIMTLHSKKCVDHGYIRQSVVKITILEHISYHQRINFGLMVDRHLTNTLQAELAYFSCCTLCWQWVLIHVCYARWRIKFKFSQRKVMMEALFHSSEAKIIHLLFVVCCAILFLHSKNEEKKKPTRIKITVFGYRTQKANSF